jgi:GMP synthase (glutamine-hydrolysing)
MARDGVTASVWGAPDAAPSGQPGGGVVDQSVTAFGWNRRAATSSDGMTADVYPFDMAFLTRVANRIVNEVRGINRVTYDVTSKPPGTSEWE